MCVCVDYGYVDVLFDIAKIRKILTTFSIPKKVCIFANSFGKHPKSIILYLRYWIPAYMALNYTTAEEVASRLENGQTLALGGFGPSGTPKAIIPVVAERAIREHEAGRPFRLNLICGSSVGASCDGAMADADAIERRYPFCVNPSIRKAYNSGRVKFTDINLSDNATYLRQGVTGELDYGIIEAVEVQEAGDRLRVYLTAGIGIAPTIVRKAKRGIFIELNHWHSQAIKGLHDIYEIEEPWLRSPIPLTHPTQLIGQPYLEVEKNKVLGIVETCLPDESRAMNESNAVLDAIGVNLADFLVENIHEGRISPTRLIMQSGVGSGANSVLRAMGANPDIPDFYIYTEVFQKTAFELLKQGRVLSASTGALSVSPEEVQEIYDNIEQFRGRLVIRPSEISNSPELISRLGICSLNTALEVDIYGHVNSTKVCGTQMMNGVGGSCDFTCHSLLSTFTCGSTAKEGRISSIVPFCSHIDHTEHYVEAIVTEYGVADLRGKCPTDKAKALIEIAHPDYRPLLRDYMKLAEKRGGHSPHVLSAAFAMHDTYLRKGDMRLTDWGEYIK